MRAMAGAFTVVVALLTAGCARPPAVPLPPAVSSPPAAPPPAPSPELVVVLPGADGKVGTVTVTHGGEEKTLDSAYATARIAGPGRIETGQATGPEIRAIFGPALDAQPPRPVSFLLFFVFGTDALTPESTEALGKIVSEVAARPSAEIIAIGHTDRVGSDQQNDVLSLQRAERVRQELVRLGIDPGGIVTVGRGEREPLIPTDDEVPQPRNRRVEITVR
jgi:outer membrane protein OmpA-like peptidoglycan-associated protein